MPGSVAESKLERKAPRYFFSTQNHSPVAMPAPPGWRSGRLPPTTPAVDAPPDSAPPRAHSALPATSENALSITASAPARIPGRHRPECESRFRAGCGKQTGSPRKGRSASVSWHNRASESMPLRPSTGFDRHQDAHLRRDLDHASPSHNARLSATNSAVATPLNSIFIRPRGPSNSTTALAEDCRTAAPSTP